VPEPCQLQWSDRDRCRGISFSSVGGTPTSR
jgi:hypothetical protein